jgi:hypothetical protein
MDELPYKVDFSKGEAFVARAWSNPRYRQRGLSDYVGFQAFRFLGENGIGIARGAVGTCNIAGQRSFTRQGRRWYAEARYLKILWWKSWKEKPLADSARHILGA